jgi:hypothetical protein
MGTYSAPETKEPPAAAAQLYTQDIPSPAKASVNEAVLKERPFLPLLEPLELEVALAVAEAEEAVALTAALDAALEPAMVAMVAKVVRAADSDHEAVAVASSDEDPPLEGHPKKAPAVTVPDTLAEVDAERSSSPLSLEVDAAEDVVEDADRVTVSWSASSVTELAVAVNVTNWTEVVVMVEVKLVLQEEDVLADEAATALATGALEALRAPSVDDSRGTGLTVTVLTPVAEEIAVPPKCVPLRGYVPPVGIAKPAPVPTPVP